MNTNPTLLEPGFDSILTELIEAKEHNSDQKLDVNQWAERYPQYADQIRSFFINRCKLEAVIGPRGVVDAEAPTIGVENKVDEAASGQRIRYFGDYKLLEEIARFTVIFKTYHLIL